jgi:hypothetical protein
VIASEAGHDLGRLPTRSERTGRPSPLRAPTRTAAQANASSPEGVISTVHAGAGRVPENQLRESAVDVHAHHALHLLLLWFDGSSGPHDNYGSALTAQPGRLQERPATNTSPRLIVGGKWWTHRRLSCGAGSGVYVKAPSSSPGD